MTLPAHQIRPKAISLFAGACGCSLGFQHAGYHIRFATDMDRDEVESYGRNFAGTAFEAQNVRELDAGALMERAGVEEGDDARNSLVRYYVRLLDGVQPRWFVIENVEGLLTNDGGVHVRDAVEASLEAGYAVNFEKVYAQGYGVPQRRMRVLIVGNRLGHDFVFPESVSWFSGSIFGGPIAAFVHAILSALNRAG